MKKTIDPDQPRTAALEALFRARVVWKKFCLKLIEERRICAICEKDLTKVHKRGKKAGKFCITPNVHHTYRNRTMGEYMNLDPSRFMLLCPNCHDWVHKVFNSPKFKDCRWVNNEESQQPKEPQNGK